jgi:hypothetical protein
MTMPEVFVGRRRELRRLRLLLESGRNAVVTGPYGSGRTALVRRLESQLTRHYRFLFVAPSDTRAELRDAVASMVKRARARSTPASGTPSGVVIVFDDVVRVTAQRARLIRGLLDDDRVRIIVIAERSVTGNELLRVRAMLNAAPVLHVGPLRESDVEQYVAACANAAGIGTASRELHGIARSTNGYALGLRLTVQSALRVRPVEPRP